MCNFMIANNNMIEIPDSDMILTPNCKIRIGRFSNTVWVLNHGWFSWGGNRPQCGWFISDLDNPSIIKPLYLTDLDDIYFIEN